MFPYFAQVGGITHLKMPTNSRVMAELAKMGSDGGVTGEPRALLTLLLGMALVDKAIEDSNAAYSMHLKKMARFLDKAAYGDALWGGIFKNAAERMRNCIVKSKGTIDFMGEFNKFQQGSLANIDADDLDTIRHALESEFDI